MSKQGTMQKPEFKTRCGLVLKIAPVNAGAMQLYMTLWEKQHKPPRPPLVTLSNGDTWHDVTDDMFKQLYAKWQQDYNTTMMDFIMKYGVLSQPPKAWRNPYSELAESDPAILKQLWLSEILYTDETVNEYTDLTEAIMGLNRPTASGLADAEKK